MPGALQKQTVDLMLAGGQDEKADPRLAVKPLQLLNTRYAFRGSLSKRFGSRAITAAADLQHTRYSNDRDIRKIYGPEARPVCTLVSSKGELLRCSRGALDRVLDQVSPISGGQLGPVDTLPTYHAERQAFPRTTAIPAHVDAYGDVVATMLKDEVTGVVYVATLDRTSLETIASGNGFSEGTIQEARVVLAPYRRDVGLPIVPTPLVFFTNAAHELRVVAIPLDHIPGGFGYVSRLIASDVGIFDVTPALLDSGSGRGLDECWITWTDTSGASSSDLITLCRVRMFDDVLTKGNTAGFGGADPAPDALAIDTIPASGIVHVGWGVNGATGDASVKAEAFTETLATPTPVWGPVTFETATGILLPPLAVKSLAPSGDQALWAWNLTAIPTANSPANVLAQTRTAYTDAAGTPFLPSTNAFSGALVISKPWLGADGSMFVMAYLVSPQTRNTGATVAPTTYAILRIYNPANPVGPRLEYDGYVSPGLASSPQKGIYNGGVQVVVRTVADRTAEGGTSQAVTFVLPCGTNTDPRATDVPQALYTLTEVWSYGAAEAGEDYIFSASAIMAYDGDRAFECAYVMRPQTPNTGTEATNPGGGLVQGARYGFRYCFSYRDARGVVHRSAPSDPTFFTVLGATSNVFAANVPLSNQFYTFTRRFDSFNGIDNPFLSGFAIEQYRTEANGATFYLETNEGNAYTIGSLTDDVLRTQPVLYTTAGALEHACPPPARYAVQALGRVFLLGTEDGNVWPSGTLIQGDAPWWNATTSFPVPGLGPITAGGELDQALIVFRENSIHAVTGDGPADSGDGAFQIQTVASDIGCIDGRSIVKVPEGLLFLSRDGIAILTRSFVVVRVGKGVERFLATGPDDQAPVGVSSAVNVPTSTEVRFSLQRYDGAPKKSEAAVCYRLDGMDDPSWSETQWATHGVAGGMRIVSAALHDNRYTWIADNGYVFQETPAAWFDGFTTTAPTQYVPMRAALAPWKPGPVQSWVRIWRVGVLADRKAPHALTVSIAYDYDASPTTVRGWTGAEVAALAREQLKVHVVKQKCEALAVTVDDTAPTDTSAGTGEGPVIAGVSLEVGVKPGMHRRPADQKR